MTYEEIPPLYRATWSAYEAFRRLGFADDDITFVAVPTVLRDGSSSKERWMHVVLTAQDKTFTVTVAPLDRPFDEAQAMLERLRVSIHDGSTSDATMERVWREAGLGDMGCFADFCATLLARSFTFPAMAN
jgi:hypothetical protein